MYGIFHEDATVTFAVSSLASSAAATIRHLRVLKRQQLRLLSLSAVHRACTEYSVVTCFWKASHLRQLPSWGGWGRLLCSVPVLETDSPSILEYGGAWRSLTGAMVSPRKLRASATV